MSARNKLSSGGRDRLARHIIAMEKFRRLSFVRSFLLAHRADFLRARLLSPNKMQSVRANDSAPKNHLWRVYQSHRDAGIVSGERYRNDDFSIASTTRQKISSNDASERDYWDDYMEAYEEMIQETATKEAPWYVVPADNKWFTGVIVESVVIDALDSLDLAYPKVDEGKLKELATAKKKLLSK